MASSANISRTVQLSLERKCTTFESHLSNKSKALDLAEEKLKCMEKNMALVIDHKDKQSEELTSYKGVDEDLKSQLRDLDKKLKELEAKYRTAVERINYYESSEYTAKVVDEYRATPEYEEELFVRCNSFFDRGYAHMLRAFHQYIPDKTLMCKAFDSIYTNPNFRNGCDFVPYTENELKEIYELDQNEGRQWTPPPPISPSWRIY